jgi:hypothetical protein
LVPRRSRRRRPRFSLFFWCALLAPFVLVFGGARVAHAGDPYLRWSTITTPHFRVHFHSGIERVAQRVATIAERAHSNLVPQLGWSPRVPTDVVLSDDSDSANGLAYGLPYNTIRLFVTAPEDMSALEDYDDWHVELVTHEYTHVLHIDNLSGLPALINAVLGRVLAPNQSQPRWILEGLAVAMESEHTSGGRLRSSQFEMYLRTDVLGDHLARLDEISQKPRRWPGGDIWYLYGSKFVEWILETYGPDTFARVATEYGKFAIKYGINRAIRRATGRTYPELYAGWKATLEARYGAELLAIRERGLREGTRLTHFGRAVFSPRFVPARCSASGAEELVFFRDDAEGQAGYYRLRSDASGEASVELVTRASGSTISPASDCSFIFESAAPSRRSYVFFDLFRLAPGVRASSGSDLGRERITTGLRARDPDVSPDARHVVYVTNDAGTSTLRIAELSDEGRLVGARRLVPSAEFEQAYTPRFSPDGRRVAYSAWTTGGYRDIRVVDVASGAFIELSHDRAVDQQPSFSPDGKTLYFTSDRSGIANVYAYDFDTSALSQVTNVVSGAYMPAPSPDGKRLVYVGYTVDGFDLFSMPLERARWLPAPPPPTRADGRPVLPGKIWPVAPYNPLPSVRPRSYEIDYGSGTFGNLLTLTTTGSDAVGLHSFQAKAGLYTGDPEWRASFDYSYDRLPFSMRLGVYRDAQPRYNYQVGETTLTVTERVVGVQSGVDWTVPGEFDWQRLALSFNVAHYEHDSPIGTRVDPFGSVSPDPSSGIVSFAHLGYSYSNAESSLYGVSAERGMTLFLSSDYAHPGFGSDVSFASVYGGVTAYALLPWLRHHVLALALSGGTGGSFVTGGFAEQPALDVYTTGLRQSGLVLRGFDPRQFAGSNYTLLNSEYRFPIWNADRGISTLPVFLETLSGTLFADWGGAYNQIERNTVFDVMHLGVGGELWIRLLLGYNIDGALRLGFAHGFGEGGRDLQSYFVASSAF